MRTPLEVLDEEIARLFAQVYAVTARALEKLAELDRLEGAAQMGYRSTAHDLNGRVGMSLGAGREHVRVAHALEKLPRVREQFRLGTLSFSKVRALTRIATPEIEQTLLDIAHETSAAQLEKIVRACRHVTLEEAQQQLSEREVVTGFDAGMFTLRARLTPEEGARLLHALDAAVKATGRDPSRDAPDRYADALMALAVGPASTVELVVHVDAPNVSAERGAFEQGEPAAEQSDEPTTTVAEVETPRGERIAIAAETARRLACDASVVVMTHGADGRVLDVGRRTRKIPAALRRALATRDGGCRFPGCANHMVDRHHIRHWAHGGETSLSKGVALILT